MTSQSSRKFLRTLGQGSAIAALYTSCALIMNESAMAGLAFNPPGGGAPQGTRGGASRGDMCIQNPTLPSPQQFMVLTPTDSNYGLTLKERPQFFAYVPSTSARQAFFSLRDENGGVIYQTRFAIARSGGIIQLSLPQSVPALEVGKSYQWGIAILCSDKLRADSPFVSAWIKRTQPTEKLVEQLKQPPSLEQAKLYGTSGIWYDTLTVLAELKLKQANNASLADAWKDLLGTVGLGEVASEPMVGRVSLTN